MSLESSSVFTSLFSTYDIWRNYSYSSVLSSVYSDHLNQVDVIQSVNTSWKSSSAANKISHAESQSATIAKYKSLYDQAHHYVKCFNLWNNQKISTLTTSDEINLYEKSFFLKMSFDDWIKLRNDLQIFKMNQKLKYSSEILKIFC